MTPPTLALCLIAKNEADNMPHLLASVEGAFDEVVLVDTGSTDDTVAIFERWAQGQVGEGRLTGYHCDTFAWVDDFAAARAHADSLASSDWLAWADADDVLRGASNLRLLAQNAPPHVVAFVADYDYAQDPHGNCVCRLRRERLVRRGHGTWHGRVHEAQLLDGPVEMVGPGVVEWVHRKQHGPAMPDSNRRNLRILRQWVKDEPENPRVLAYLGTEEMTRGKIKRAVPYFRRYLKLKTGWDEERAQVHRKLAACLMAQGKHQGARQLAFQALELLPSWPDSHLTLAEAHYQQGEPVKAIHWAERVLEMGQPDTLLIVNPTDYAVQPRVVLAGAHAALGQIDQAIAHAEQVLQMVPGHPLIQHAYQGWLSTRKRESTANTFCAAAELLVAHDEQAKALQVLRSAPYFAQDHPRVVALRSLLRERLDHLYEPDTYATHYAEGGSKPEDFVEDPITVGDQLPRCAFLLNGLREQAGAVAA